MENPEQEKLDNIDQRLTRRDGSRIPLDARAVKQKADMLYHANHANDYNYDLAIDDAVDMLSGKPPRHQQRHQQANHQSSTDQPTQQRQQSPQPQQRQQPKKQTPSRPSSLPSKRYKADNDNDWEPTDVVSKAKDVWDKVKKATGFSQYQKAADLTSKSFNKSK